MARAPTHVLPTPAGVRRVARDAVRPASVAARPAADRVRAPRGTLARLVTLGALLTCVAACSTHPAGPRLLPTDASWEPGSFGAIAFFAAEGVEVTVSTAPRIGAFPLRGWIANRSGGAIDVVVRAERATAPGQVVARVGPRTLEPMKDLTDGAKFTVPSASLWGDGSRLIEFTADVPWPRSDAPPPGATITCSLSWDAAAGRVTCPIRFHVVEAGADGDGSDAP